MKPILPKLFLLPNIAFVLLILYTKVFHKVSMFTFSMFFLACVLTFPLTIGMMLAQQHVKQWRIIAVINFAPILLAIIALIAKGLGY